MIQIPSLNIFRANKKWKSASWQHWWWTSLPWSRIGYPGLAPAPGFPGAGAAPRSPGPGAASAPTAPKHVYKSN